MSLFRVSEPLKIKLPNAEIEYTPAFFNLEESSRLFEAIYHETNWIEEDIRVYGKVYKQPRLTAFFASNPAPIITLGFEVLVQEVIAAITISPSVILKSAPATSA